MPRPRVAILGGGAAGAVAALVLARSGFITTLLEARPGPEFKIGETLPPEIRPLLERLDLLDELEAAHHRPSFGNRSHWGSDEAVERDFLLGAHGSGWHLDRRRFETMLADEAAAAGAHWHWDHHAVDATWQDGVWALEVETPAELARFEVDFVVDATGRPSRFALGAGAHKTHFDKLVGVAATLETDRPGARIDSFTLVEAVENGWWYSAGLTGGRLVAVFMGDGDLFDVKSTRTEQGWLGLLEAAVHTRSRLEAHLPAAPGAQITPAVLPAGSALLEAPSGEGWLAVGDAAVLAGALRELSSILRYKMRDEKRPPRALRHRAWRPPTRPNL